MSIKVIQGIRFYTIRQVAGKLDISYETARNFINHGFIKTTQIAKRKYVSELSLIDAGFLPKRFADKVKTKMGVDYGIPYYVRKADFDDPDTGKILDQNLGKKKTL